ncbi:MAG: hypothetical protein CSA62_02025 [Planctomycetota bacterium]|nr:MAG: hypothetical protein CSA62_02025 [Planctomycetota bacterium]
MAPLLNSRPAVPVAAALGSESQPNPSAAPAPLKESVAPSVFDPREERLVDVRIARDVLGFETRELVGAPEFPGGRPSHVAWLMLAEGETLWQPLPCFSTEEGPARQVLAFVYSHGVEVETVRTRGWWCVEIEGVQYPKSRRLSMAICRAALGFVGSD